jgi:hypothetical protein
MGMSNAREQLAQMNRARFDRVSDQLTPGEHLIDTGSARAEQVPSWRQPVGDEDFGGFIVVTNRQIIYRDYFGVVAIPWSDIRELSKYRVRGLMTTGLEVTFANGNKWLFSGNTPFIKSLIKLAK